MNTLKLLTFLFVLALLTAPVHAAYFRGQHIENPRVPLLVVTHQVHDRPVYAAYVADVEDYARGTRDQGTHMAIIAHPTSQETAVQTPRTKVQGTAFCSFAPLGYGYGMQCFTSGNRNILVR